MTTDLMAFVNWPTEDLPRHGLTDAERNEYQDLITSMRSAFETTPENHARALSLGAPRGVGPRLVAVGGKPLESKLEFEATDWKALQKRSPVLAQRLASDPDFAALARDNLLWLGWFEDEAKALTEYGGEALRQARGSRRQIDYAHLATREMLAEKGLKAPLSAEERQFMYQSRYLGSLAQDVPYRYRESFWTSAPLSAAQQIPNMWELTKSGLGWGVVGGGLGLISGGGGAGTGFRVGSAIGTWKGSFELEAGPLWHDLREVRDEYGNPLNPDDAWAIAFVGGSLIGALDAVSFGRTASTLKPLKEAVKRRILRAAASRSFRKAVTDWMGRYAVAVGTETLTEAAQELISVASEDIAALTAGTDTELPEAIAEWATPENLQATLERGRPRAEEAAQRAFESMVVIGGLTSTSGLALNLSQTKKARADYAVLLETGKRVQESELFKRHKGLFESFAASALATERDPNVYLELKPFLTSLEKQRVDAQAAMAALGVEDQVGEALEVTGEVRIPLSRVLSMADQPYYDALLVDLRTSLDATTPRRAEARLAEIQATLAPEEAAEAAPAEGEAAEVPGTEAVGLEQRPAETDPLAAQVETRERGEAESVSEATRRAERLATAPSRAALDASADLIERDLQAKIEGAARRVGKGFESVYGAAPYNARLIAEHYRAMGALLGEDPYRLYRQAGLTVAGPLQADAQLRKALNDIRAGRLPEGRRLRRYPVLSMIAERGGLHPDSPAAADLRNLGVTNKTVPGIFRRKARAADAPQPMRSLDALVLSEEPLFQGRGRAEGYIEPQEILDAVAAELRGEPLRTEEELAQVQGAHEYHQSLQQVLDELGLDPSTMSNEEIIAALREAETGIEAMTLFQPAYHGTPHRFDKFTLEHIGTGEGAQSYGWGLYFAGKREVAEYYRRTLSDAQAPIVTIDGRMVSLESPEFLKKYFTAGRIVTAYGGYDKVLDFKERSEFSPEEELPTGILRWSKWSVRTIECDKDGNVESGASPRWHATIPPRKQLIDFAKAHGFSPAESGQLYKIDIPEDSELLDWDKPLSEQPEEIQAAVVDVVRNFGRGADTGFVEDVTGYGDVLEFRGIMRWDPDGPTPELDRLRDAAREADRQYRESGFRQELKAARDATEQQFEAALEQAQRTSGTWHIDHAATGRDIYKSLATVGKARDPESASRALLAAGIPGLRYLDQGSRSDGEGTHNYVIWDEDAIQVLETFYQQGETEPRAFITFNPERTQAAIRLLKTADVSSFLHETGHLYLESLRSFAARPDAPQQLVEDWTALREEMGLSEGEIPAREHHEWFAEQWEAYVATGRAPSLRLREAFERFTQWLRALWDAAKRQRVEVNPVVAEVLDRLLTTPRDRLEIQIRDEVASEVRSRPSYRALQDLEAGVPAEVAAEAWGFNPDELEELAAHPPNWGAVIDGLTARRIEIEHPEADFDPATYAATQGQQAIFTNDRAAALSEELNTLRQQAGMARDVGISETMRARAHRLIAGKRIREIRPLEYQAQERRAGAEALEAARRGVLEDAAKAKERQLLLHHLFVAAKKAESEIDRHHKHMSRYNRETVRNGIRQSIAASKGQHLAQIDKLRSRFGLSGRAIDPDVMSFGAWVKRLKDQEHIEVVTEWAEFETGNTDEPSQNLLTENDRPMDWREFRVEQLAGLRDTLDNIEHLARNANKTWTDEQNRTLDENVERMTSSIYAKNKVHDEPLEWSSTARQMFGKALSSVHAAHTKPEFLFDWLDAYEARGPVWETLGLPIQRAFDAEVLMFKDKAGALDKIWARYTPAEKRAFYSNTRFTIPEVEGRRFTKIELFTMWLNWGNEGNREALMAGTGWTREQVEACLSRLTKKDLDIGQAIWDLLETFREPIGKLHYELTGTRLKWVEADAIDTKHGTYRGGYYPLAYDKDRKWLTLKRAEVEQALGMGVLNYTRLMTRDGHRRARVGSAGQVVQLDLSVLTNHLRNVIHDLTHTKMLQDLYRLTEDARFRKAVETTHGSAGYRLIRPYLRELARDLSEPYDMIDHALAHARAGATVVNMGFKWTTMIQQPLGIFQAWDYMNVQPGLKGTLSGTYYVIRGMRKFYGRPDQIPEKIRFVWQNSPQMESRPRNWDREIRDYAKRSKAKGVIADRESIALIGAAWAEFSVTIPTWLGAYDQGMEVLFNGDPDAHRKSTEWADKVIRNSQGSGAVKDLASIVRGGPKTRIFTMFYTFFSAQYNTMSRRLNLTRRQGLSGAPAFAVFLGGSWVGSALLAAWVSGQGPEDDEGWTEWAIKELAYYPASTLIGIRDLAGAILFPEFGFELSPVGDVGEKLATAATAPDKGEVTRGEAKAIALSLGYLLKLPAKQAWMISEEIWEYMTGRDADLNFRDALYGERKK